jgi:hypothetical protein
VKCNEIRPICGGCEERAEPCEWPILKQEPSRHKHPRAITSCKECRARKVCYQTTQLWLISFPDQMRHQHCQPMHLLQPSRPDVLGNSESWLIAAKGGKSSAVRGRSIAYTSLVQRNIQDLLHRSNNSSRRHMHPSGRAGYDQRSRSLVL